MNAREFNAARHAFGLGRKDFGSRVLGFTGDPRNIWVTVKRWENGERAIPENIQRLVQLAVWFKEDYGYLPDLDNGRREPMQTPEGFSDD